ncbi:MAG: fibrillarin-like rRNA/tRNA 2'-O-methyltransferase [Thermoplasmata archaeon]|nr:fibrillarin-like rRNA/tRNA 2'-O-methyltransferase [Thermoplasmata archaeon]
MSGIERTRWPGILRSGTELFTVNLRPGRAVYGETLRPEGTEELRTWDPWRSKLAAYLLHPSASFDLSGVRRLLYLGAAHGTTASHLSDLLPAAQLFLVEKSPSAFGQLLALSRERENLLPLLADAQMPERYRAELAPVEWLYQDIAQRDQTRIFAENAAAALAPGGRGLLMLKVRSVTQRRSPRELIQEARSELARAGLSPRPAVDLAPYSRDHAAIAVQS